MNGKIFARADMGPEYIRGQMRKRIAYEAEWNPGRGFWRALTSDKMISSSATYGRTTHAGLT